MKYASALPFTEQERQNCASFRAKLVRKGIKRRDATPSGQNYNVPGNADSKRLDQRRTGELSTTGKP